MTGYLYVIAALGSFAYRGDTSYMYYTRHNIHRKFYIHLVNMGILSAPWGTGTVVMRSSIAAGIQRLVLIIRRYCTKTKINRVGIHNLKVKQLLES